MGRKPQTHGKYTRRTWRSPGRLPRATESLSPITRLSANAAAHRASAEAAGHVILNAIAAGKTQKLHVHGDVRGKSVIFVQIGTKSQSEPKYPTLTLTPLPRPRRILFEERNELATLTPLPRRRQEATTSSFLQFTALALEDGSAS